MIDALSVTARSWLGTRFVHQGRRKRQVLPDGRIDHGGVDCLGLLVGVAQELHLTARDGTPLHFFDKTDYGWLPDGEALALTLDHCLTRLPQGKENVRVGDVVLLRLDGNPQHLGMILDGVDAEHLNLMHAYFPARKVVEHGWDAYWQSKLVAAYRVPNFLA